LPRPSCTQEALDQLAIAIRKQGASTAGEAWNMLQDNSNNPKPLTAFQLKSKVKSLFGVEISEYQAQRECARTSRLDDCISSPPLFPRAIPKVLFGGRRSGAGKILILCCGNLSDVTSIRANTHTQARTHTHAHTSTYYLPTCVYTSTHAYPHLSKARTSPLPRPRHPE
jgi:hypothetical protein